MNGKAFLTLVSGLAITGVGAGQLQLHGVSWWSVVDVAGGIAVLALAFHYWRRSRAKGP